MKITCRDIGDYKYELLTDSIQETGITGYEGGDTEGFIRIDREGKLYQRRGYCWNGCSGPTRDDETNERGGLIHDGLYQLIQLRVLPFSCVDPADALFRAVCLEDGMSAFRARYYYYGVHNPIAHLSARP